MQARPAQRRWTMWVAFPLATLVHLFSWRSGYGAILFVPVVSFLAASFLGLVARRWPFLWGTLSAGLVIGLLMLHWSLTASPDQLEVYGRVPLHPMAWFSLVPTWLGAMVAWVRLRRTARRV